MQRIDSGSQVATMPTPPAEVAPGFFKDGQIGEGSGTVVDAAFMNSVQEELCTVIEDRGITLDREDNDQLLLAIGDIVSEATPDASETVKGLVELATLAEMIAGTDNTRAITPASLGNADTSNRGVVELADDAEAASGTAGDKAVTPANLGQDYDDTPAAGYLPIIGTTLMIQWIVDDAVSNGDYLTFATPFASVNYAAVGCSNGAGARDEFSLQKIDASTVRVFISSDGHPLSVIAIGQRP